MSKPIELKVGETVVHLSHGIGIVASIETRDFAGGNSQAFYILEIDDNGAPKRVFVPVESAGQRVRKVMGRETLARVRAILQGPPRETGQTWNRRYREYMEQIASGDPLKLAEVVCDLNHLNREKDLSFGERKMLDHAATQLDKEMRHAAVAP